MQVALFVSIGLVSNKVLPYVSDYAPLVGPLIEQAGPLLTNMTEYIGPILPNLEAYSQGYVSALHQIAKVYGLVSQVESVVPFAISVASQYQQCAPLLQKVC